VRAGADEPSLRNQKESCVPRLDGTARAAFAYRLAVVCIACGRELERRGRRHSQKDLSTTRATLGFSIAGMQLYDARAKQTRKRTKLQCRAIKDANQLRSALRSFFSNQPGGGEGEGENVRAVCGDAHGVISRLRALAAWCVSASCALVTHSPHWWEPGKKEARARLQG
jgi:hypothetical protein